MLLSSSVFIRPRKLAVLGSSYPSPLNQVGTMNQSCFGSSQLSIRRMMPNLCQPTWKQCRSNEVNDERLYIGSEWNFEHFEQYEEMREGFKCRSSRFHDHNQDKIKMLPRRSILSFLPLCAPSLACIVHNQLLFGTTFKRNLSSSLEWIEGDMEGKKNAYNEPPPLPTRTPKNLWDKKLDYTYSHTARRHLLEDNIFSKSKESRKGITLGEEKARWTDSPQSSKFGDGYGKLLKRHKKCTKVMDKRSEQFIKHNRINTDQNNEDQLDPHGSASQVYHGLESRTNGDPLRQSWIPFTLSNLSNEYLKKVGERAHFNMDHDLIVTESERPSVQKVQASNMEKVKTKQRSGTSQVSSSFFKTSQHHSSRSILLPVESRHVQDRLNRAEMVIKNSENDRGLKTCWGCGADFQHTNTSYVGYVDKKVFQSYLDARKEYEKYQSDISNTWMPTDDLLALEREILDVDEMEQGQDLLRLKSLKLPEKTHPYHQEIDEYDNEKPSIPCVSPDRIVCERCWTLRNHSRIRPVAIDPSYFSNLLEPIKSKPRSTILVVKVVDLFDFHGSFVPSLSKYIGNQEVLLVATKIDLMPSGASLQRIKSWIYAECKKFNILPVNVCLVSSRKGSGMVEAWKSIEYYRRERDVYFVGSANGGKSTLINGFINRYQGPHDRKSTVSSLPGTTLNIITLPIGGNKGFMYDTPGIVTGKQIYHLLSHDELKRVMPKKTIRPSVYRIQPGITLFLGGLARFDYAEGSKLIYLTVFMSQEIYVHKCKTENAQQLMEGRMGTLLQPPSSPSTLNQWPGLKARPIFHIDNRDGNWNQACADIVFSGLGWISITQKGQVGVRVWYPDECVVGQRQPLMPFESKLGKLPNPRSNQKPSSIFKEI